MKRRVLIVDDEHAIVETLSEVLVDEGYDVVSASDGAQALERLRDERPPDVMLLDMMMPILDGWQVLERVKGSGEWNGMPIVLMSAGIVPTAQREQACEFVAKPFTLDELLRALDRCLKGASGSPPRPS